MGMGHSCFGEDVKFSYSISTIVEKKEILYCTSSEPGSLLSKHLSKGFLIVYVCSFFGGGLLFCASFFNFHFGSLSLANSEVA